MADRIICTDTVEFTDTEEIQGMRGYIRREFKDGLIFWIWDRQSVGLPISRIKSITTTTE